MTEARIQSLNERHAKLEKMIAEEIARPLPDTLLVSTLKKLKLSLKDQIAGLSDGERKAEHTIAF